MKIGVVKGEGVGGQRKRREENKRKGRNTKETENEKEKGEKRKGCCEKKKGRVRVKK